jgi:hypothetical protein
MNQQERIKASLVDVTNNTHLIADSEKTASVYKAAALVASTIEDTSFARFLQDQATAAKQKKDPSYRRFKKTGNFEY